MLCSRTINVDRPEAYHARVGTSQPPGPVDDAEQEGAYEVEQLLNSQTDVEGGDVLPRTFPLIHVGRR